MVDVNELTSATLAVAEVCSSTTDYVYSTFENYKQLPKLVRTIIDDLDSIHTSLNQLEIVLRAVDGSNSSKVNRDTYRATQILISQCQRSFTQLMQVFSQENEHEEEQGLENRDHMSMEKREELVEVGRKLRQHNEDLSALIVELGRDIGQTNGYQNHSDRPEARSYTHDIPTPPPEYKTRASSDEEDSEDEREESSRNGNNNNGNGDGVLNIVINFDVPSSPSDDSAYASAPGDQDRRRVPDTLPALPEAESSNHDYPHDNNRGGHLGRSRSHRYLEHDIDARHLPHDHDHEYPYHHSLPGEFPDVDDDDDPPRSEPYEVPTPAFEEERYFYPSTMNGTHAPNRDTYEPSRQHSYRGEPRAQRQRVPSYHIQDVEPEDYRNVRNQSGNPNGNLFHYQFEQPLLAAEKQLQPYNGNGYEDEEELEQRYGGRVTPQRVEELRPHISRINTISTEGSHRQPEAQEEARPHISRINTIATEVPNHQPEAHEEVRPQLSRKNTHTTEVSNSHRQPEGQEELRPHLSRRNTHSTEVSHRQPEVQDAPEPEPERTHHGLNNAGEAAQYLQEDDAEPNNPSDRNGGNDQPEGLTITITHTTTEPAPAPAPISTQAPSNAEQLRPVTELVPMNREPHHRNSGESHDHVNGGAGFGEPEAPMGEERSRTPLVHQEERAEPVAEYPVEAVSHDEGSATEKKHRRQKPRRRHTRDGEREPEYYDSHSDNSGRHRDRSRGGEHSNSERQRRPSHRRRRTRRGVRHTEVSYSSNNVTLNNIHLTPYPTPPGSTTTETPRRSEASNRGYPHPLQTTETAPPTPSLHGESAAMNDGVRQPPPIRVQRMPVEVTHESVGRRRDRKGRSPPKKLSTWGVFKQWFKGCCCGP